MDDEVTGMSETFLRGKEEISAAVGRSWKVVKEWIDECGFPASKINGVWQSDRALIAEWFRDEIRKRVRTHTHKTSAF